MLDEACILPRARSVSTAANCCQALGNTKTSDLVHDLHSRGHLRSEVGSAGPGRMSDVEQRLESCLKTTLSRSLMVFQAGLFTTECCQIRSRPVCRWRV